METANSDLLKKFRFYEVLPLLLFSFFALWLGYKLTNYIQGIWSEVAAQAIYYAFSLIAIALYLNIRTISFYQLLNRQKFEVGHVIVYSLMLFAFTTGLYHVVYGPLLEFFPDFLESWVLGFPEIIFISNNPEGTASVLALPTIIAIFLVVMAAPVFEELMFRGLIFQAVALKYNCAAGIIVSSALFAILHGDVVGAFVFAIFICWLYQKTGSLLSVIVCHSINNFLFVIYQIIIQASNNFVKPESIIETYKSGIYFGAFLLIISSYWAIKTFKSAVNRDIIPYCTEK